MKHIKNIPERCGLVRG